LKEKLCILWGDLEEQKSALLPPDSTSVNPLLDEPSSSPILKADQLPMDSDDEENITYRKAFTLAGGPAPKEQDTNTPTTGNAIDPLHPPTRNKAFTCCIKQYGVKEKERDPRKANAGKGKRWVRKFGMFGVTVA
jgi:protection-of-telomeres protein 1